MKEFLTIEWRIPPRRTTEHHCLMRGDEMLCFSQSQSEIRRQRLRIERMIENERVPAAPPVSVRQALYPEAR
jgi:hypothetical protein